MRISSIVVLKNQIVFELAYLNCSSKVTTFKPGFEDKCVIVNRFLDIVGIKFRVKSIES